MKPCPPQLTNMTYYHHLGDLLLSQQNYLNVKFIFIIHVLLLIIMILTQITTNKERQQISVENSCFDFLSLLLHSINGEVRSNTFKHLIGNILPSVLNFVFSSEGFLMQKDHISRFQFDTPDFLIKMPF